MPAPGFKSITVKDAVYDFFWKEWKKVEGTEYAIKHGITSFSGYVSHRLYTLMQLEKKCSPK